MLDLYIQEPITTTSSSTSTITIATTPPPNEIMPPSSEHDASNVIYRNLSYESDLLLLDDGPAPYPKLAPGPPPTPRGSSVTYIEQPTKGDWESAKPLIRHLWVNKGLRLAEVRRRLEAHGFPASESMYKKHLQRWAKEDLTWRKQKYTKSAVPKRNRVSASASASSSPSMSPAPVIMPQHHQPQIISPDFPLYLLPDQLLQSLLLNVSGMYRGALHDGRWKMRDALTIQENEYDDLFLIIFKTLHYTGYSDAVAGEVGMREAFPSLRRAVQECGFFSLPTIWTAVIHIVRRGHMQFASRFIAEAARLAGLLHPNSHLQLIFVDMLRLLGHDAGIAEHALVSAYAQCIRDVTAGLEGLPFSHLTALTLRNFFIHYIVYVDTTPCGTAQSMRAFEDLLELAEQIYDKDDEVVLEILAQWIMCLEIDPDAGYFLAQVTNDMLMRIASRRRKHGGTFKWNLLPKWRGVKSVLSIIHQRQEEMEWLAEAMCDSMTSIDMGPRDLEEASRTHLAMWRDKTATTGCAPLVYT
ncbi:hypothetical protein F4810DRAFT_648005 [Camillea tinctor]|nr:hypothetical protein F4810DRAFT_648005 [Camillea tinctor]